jgi:hypothetical protein
MERNAAPARIRRLRAFEFEIHNDRFLTAPDNDCLAGLIW